ncbi:hypothetical protein, variant [Allomyces macrogynus ATCC 38327]|uniref:Uncharacterized protein n=1 Tax=Allomyces macrogynus (strain ATCC 38327) TaxID=578462 RepID=A0A0L0T1B7_ALLM3|nr:hypothetical protein, variant [Allomyces macrogynus ATCC 38327]|eukprot:KNE68536.1 hypothetical protein, variant [Allomyces macrogynus ATCC 38327]
MAQSKKSAHASKSASSSAPISATPVSKSNSRLSNAANSLTTLNETVPHAAAVDPPLVPINTNATVEDLYRQIHALQLTLSMTRKASRHLLSVGQSLEADKLAADRALAAKAHECDLLAAEVVDLRKQVADVRATLGTMRRALESARDELARRRTVEAEFATLREKFHAEMEAMEVECAKLREAWTALKLEMGQLRPELQDKAKQMIKMEQLLSAAQANLASAQEAVKHHKARAAAAAADAHAADEQRIAAAEAAAAAETAATASGIANGTPAPPPPTSTTSSTMPNGTHHYHHHHHQGAVGSPPPAPMLPPAHHPTPPPVLVNPDGTVTPDGHDAHDDWPAGEYERPLSPPADLDLSDLYPNSPSAHPGDPGTAAATRFGPSSSVNGHHHHPASASVTGDDLHDDEDDEDVEDVGELGDEDLDEDEDAGDEDGGDEYDDDEEDDEEEAMLDEEEVDEDEDDEEEEEEKSYNDLARDFLRCLELKDYAGFCSNVAHLVTHEQAQHVNDWNALAIGALWLIAMAGDCHSLHPVSRGLTPTLTETHVQNVIESLPDVRDRHEWVLTIAQLHESAVHNSPREFYAMLDSLAASNMVKQVSPLRDILNALRILQRIRFLNWFIVSDNRYKRSNQVSLRMAVFKTDFRDVTQLRQWLERELDGTDTPLNLGAGGKTLLEARTVKQKLHDKLKGAENTYKKALEYLTTAIPPAVPGTIIRKH